MGKLVVWFWINGLSDFVKVERGPLFLCDEIAKWRYCCLIQDCLAVEDRLEIVVRTLSTMCLHLNWERSLKSPDWVSLTLPPAIVENSPQKVEHKVCKK